MNIPRDITKMNGQAIEIQRTGFPNMMVWEIVEFKKQRCIRLNRSLYNWKKNRFITKDVEELLIEV